MDKINLEEILADSSINMYAFREMFPELSGAVLYAMKEACQRALELAADNAEGDVKFYGWGRECQLDASEYSVVINKRSILSVINLIE